MYKFQKNPKFSMCWWYFEDFLYDQLLDTCNIRLYSHDWYLGKQNRGINYFGKRSRYDELASRMEIINLRYGGKEHVWTMEEWPEAYEDVHIMEQPSKNLIHVPNCIPFAEKWPNLTSFESPTIHGIGPTTSLLVFRTPRSSLRHSNNHMKVVVKILKF